MNTLELLRNIPYFKTLKRKAFEELYQKSGVINLKCGNKLLRQGDIGDDIFVLLDGRLRAIREEDDDVRILGEISRGEIVGEMAALLGEKRNATIIAVRDSTLLKLNANDFTDLLQKQKTSLTQLVHTVVERTKKSFVPKHKITSVAIVPLDASLALDNLLSLLVQQLQNHATAKHLSSSIMESEHPITINDKNTLQYVLANYEDKYDIVIYQTAGTWNDWTEQCVRRADKIIIVADGKQSPEIKQFEKQLAEMLKMLNHAAWELILLHNSKAEKPQNTRFWLEKRNLKRHYHIVHNDIKDIQRLARFLTGNTIGVALSGGGSRAVSQAGILHAMMEAGIPIDIIGGSSGGALIGGSYCCIEKTDDFSKMVKKGSQLFKNAKVMTFPIVSLFSGKNFTKAINGLFDEVKIEDLWIDFFCLSLSLVSGKLMIHETGSLWKSVRASTSVMGIVPPVLEDGDCLVDGGLINACPTNILVQKGAGKVIVINASTQSGIETDAIFPPTVSGWSLLFKKLNPFNKEKITPGIVTNITQSMYMASNHLQDRVYSESNIDLFIVPPIENATSMTLDSGMELYKAGYDYGVSQIETWKKQLNIS